MIALQCLLITSFVQYILSPSVDCAYSVYLSAVVRPQDGVSDGNARSICLVKATSFVNRVYFGPRINHIYEKCCHMAENKP
jgi:hypothetical protein